MNRFSLLLTGILTFTMYLLNAAEVPMVLHTSSGDIHGTLLLPENASRPPVVLIIAGSGPTDRNGNQKNLVNNSLKQLADSLGSHGIASLRYDKRGVAGSEIEGLDPTTLRFEHYVADASGWVKLLAADTRFSRVVVAGHSEGALIGMLSALENPSVKAYISIAGAARPADQMIREQLSVQPDEVKMMVWPRLDTLKRGDTLTDVPPVLNSLFHRSVQPYLISWFKYDPAKEIARLTIPALLIQGTTDVQVLEKDASMLKAAYPAARLQMVTHMNHVLKEFESTNKRAQVRTYSDPDMPLHKDLIPAIVSFIDGSPGK